MFTMEDYSNDYHYDIWTPTGMLTYGITNVFGGALWIGGRGNPRFTQVAQDLPNYKQLDCSEKTEAYAAADYRAFGIVMIGGLAVDPRGPFRSELGYFAAGYPVIGYGWSNNLTVPWSNMKCGVTNVYPSSPSPANIRGKWKAMQNYLINLEVSSTLDVNAGLIYWYGMNPLPGTKMLVVKPDAAIRKAMFVDGTAKFYDFPMAPPLVIQIPVDDCNLTVSTALFHRYIFSYDNITIPALCNAIWNIYPTENAIAKCASFNLTMRHGNFVGMVLAPHFDVQVFANNISSTDKYHSWFTGKAIVRSMTTRYTEPATSNSASRRFADTTMMMQPYECNYGFRGCIVDCS
jgi:hypothetical protein